MIKPAILYKDQVAQKMTETWYDPDYMYYYDTTPGIPDIADKPDNQYQFVSVNEQGEVVGFFSYWVYEPSQRAMNFGLIAFKKHNRTFIKDAIQMFKDMFEKFGVKSAEWRCYSDNTEALKLYRNVIKKYGGVEVGRLRRNGAPQNRKVCDTIIFEVLRQDLFWENGRIVSKKEWTTHFNEWCDGIRDIDGTPKKKLPELPELKINQVEPGWNPFE